MVAVAEPMSVAGGVAAVAAAAVSLLWWWARFHYARGLEDGWQDARGGRRCDRRRCRRWSTHRFDVSWPTATGGTVTLFVYSRCDRHDDRADADRIAAAANLFDALAWPGVEPSVPYRPDRDLVEFGVRA